jgi:hypothetical protein
VPEARGAAPAVPVQPTAPRAPNTHGGCRYDEQRLELIV